MSVADFVERMRNDQAALFDTTVDVTRQSGFGSFDESTASYDDATTTTIYSGPALVRPNILTGRMTVITAGETTVQGDQYMIKLPVDTDIAVGDVVTISASNFDAQLVGKTVRVETVLFDEWQICRRAVATDQTARPM